MTQSSAARPSNKTNVGVLIIKDSNVTGDHEIALTDSHALEIDYWEEFVQDRSPDILALGHVCIADDSGFSDVGKLLYGAQYLFAALMFGGALVNVFALYQADLPPILAGSHLGGKFLVSKHILAMFMGPGAEHMDILVPSLELAHLSFLLLRAIRHTVVAVFAPVLFGRHGQMRRWFAVSALLWGLFPFLASYSLMKMLYYVTPTVVGTEACMVIYDVEQRIAGMSSLRRKAIAALPLLWYVVSRLTCLILGLDAFLIKAREAAGAIDKEALELKSVFVAVIFLFQTLCIVDLNLFVRERLFIFVFAGEDGTLEPDEAARKQVWNALLAKRIYEHFGFWKFMVVMLGFDDYDLQLLVLDVTKKQGRKVV